MSKRLILRIAFAMLAVALALEGMPKRATAANSGSNSPSYKAENCQKIYVPGPEDVTIDQSIGQAFISSCDRWGKHAKGGSPGAIYVLDLEILNPQAVGQPRRLSFDLEKERFCPGGISLHRGEDGKRMLFVVNRLEDGDHSVEIFSLEQDQLHHLGSVEDPDFLTSPNITVAFCMTAS